MRRVRWIMVSGVLFALMACAGDPGDGLGEQPTPAGSPNAPASPVVPPAPAPAPTATATATALSTPEVVVAEAPSSSPVETETDIPPESMAAVSETTTSSAPVTTAPLDLSAEVREGLVDTFRRYRLCFSAPDLCDPASYAAPGTTFHEQAVKNVAGLLRDGLYIDDSPHTKIFIERVTQEPSGEIVVLLCYVDRATMMHTLETPDRADDAVVNEFKLSDYRAARVVLVEGLWLFSSYELIERFDGKASCSNV